ERTRKEVRGLDVIAPEVPRERSVELGERVRCNPLRGLEADRGRAIVPAVERRLRRAEQAFRLRLVCIVRRRVRACVAVQEGRERDHASEQGAFHGRCPYGSGSIVGPGGTLRSTGREAAGARAGARVRGATAALVALDFGGALSVGAG